MGLKLFASPLKEQEKSHTFERNPPQPHSYELHDLYRKGYNDTKTPVVVNYSRHTREISTTELPLVSHDESLHDSPAFHRHAEATSIELFYDLFFVANLTTFTNVHEVNDHKCEYPVQVRLVENSSNPKLNAGVWHNFHHLLTLYCQLSPPTLVSSVYFGLPGTKSPSTTYVSSPTAYSNEHAKRSNSVLWLGSPW
jgi:hypothetical protein